MLLHVAHLLQGIAFQRVGCLGDILVTTDFGKRAYLVLALEHLSHLMQLVGIVGGHNQFLHAYFFIVSNPSPNTPSTLLIDTKALPSICLMRENIWRLSYFLARMSSTWRFSLV